MKEYKENLTLAAKPDIFAKAKELKRESTEAEKILWKHIRNKQVQGKKFRRQHPLDIFIADFYCHEKKLIIELDGGYHETLKQKEYDDGRSYELEEKGYKIIRFKNEDVINHIEKVIEEIIKVLN
jgi:very-short-patch-repair endonuclease